MAKTTRTEIQDLFDETVRELTQRVRTGEATSADIQAAIKLVQNAGLPMPTSSNPDDMDELFDAVADDEELPEPSPLHAVK